jgi:predicted dehydrogenase
VGIIGLSASGGWAARAHVPALRALDGYELRALTASTKDKAAAAAATYDVPLAFGTPGELAACDEVDLVVVAVRVPQHTELIHAAIDAGKAVLCEWPLARNRAEARELADAARDMGVLTATGLQARSAPAIRYVADLVADGYVGDVLSSTLTGSGGNWGATAAGEDSHYLLDAANGATMLTIPFGHTIDAVAAVLGEPVVDSATLTTRQAVVTDTQSGRKLPKNAADQITLAGTLPGGAVLSAHYRGGTSKGTNLRWEINGTDGDLVIEAAAGHLQIFPPTVHGGRGADKELTVVEVPASYDRVRGTGIGPQMPAHNVAHAYAQLLDDVRSGTRVVPDFDHAVRRHGTLQAIMDKAGQPWQASGA